MYIGSRRQRRRSSPVRVLVLLALIGAAIYIYTMVRQEQIKSPFVPTPTPTRSAPSYADEAEALYRQGKLGEAIEVYERAIALDDEDVLLYIPLVRLLAIEGRTIDAVRLGERAVEMAEENARAWAVLGMAYDWNGDVDAAINACGQAIELDPTYAEAYAYLAEAYADAGRIDDALETIETALKLDEYSVDVQRNHGYVLERWSDYAGAVAAYERALAIHPNLAYIHIAVGRNYSVLGDLETAVVSFQRAIEIDEHNVEAHYRLGRAYYDAQDYEEARTHFEDAIEQDPGFGAAYGYLAFTYWRRRNPKDTVPNLERAIELECQASRQKAEAFYVTLEDRESDLVLPSGEVVARGDLSDSSAGSEDLLRATLAPAHTDDEAWADVEGAVTLNARTGEYTVEMESVPQPPPDQVYVGWFDGLNALSGDPLNTGPLDVESDGAVDAQLTTGWVEGPRIDFFYVLGLAHYYLDECEQSYPLFYAALQINPQEQAALDGIELCQELEQGTDASE